MSILKNKKMITFSRDIPANLDDETDALVTSVDSEELDNSKRLTSKKIKMQNLIESNYGVSKSASGK